MLSWIASFRQPMLTRSERRLRLCVPVCLFIGVALFVCSWRPIFIPRALALSLGLGGIFASLVARDALIRCVYRSRRVLREGAYLICPECLYDLRRVPRAGTSQQCRCPECGGAADAASLQSGWRDAYRIHAFAWTSESNDDDSPFI